MSKTIYWSYLRTYIPNHPNNIPLFSDLKHYDLERLSKRLDMRKFFGDAAMHCPAIIDETKNTFVMRSNIDLHIKFDYKSQSIDISDNNNWAVDANDVIRTILSGDSAEQGDVYNLTHTKVVFFCEESLNVTQLPAYYDQNDFTDSVMGLSGTFDISSWMRPLSAAFKMKEQCDEIKINAGDAISYFKFNTTDTVVLRRFESESIQKEILSNTSAFNRFKSPRIKYNTLKMCYDAWNRNLYSKKAIKLIKENLID